MKLLGLRKFTGGAMADVIRYLQGDLHKAFLDLTTVLQARTRMPEIQGISRSGIPMGPSSSVFNAIALTLPAGVWHLVGHIYFDRGSTGHAFGVTRTWLTRTGSVAGIPDDARAGYNYAVMNTVAENFEELSMMCHWALDLSYEQTVYLQARSVYGGGAGTPTCGASIVATGFVLE